MQTITSDLISGKRVLLRYDIDVPLEPKTGSLELVVAEEFRLKAGLATLNLCLENSPEVVLIGHLGRPEGQIVKELKVAPVIEWFRSNGYGDSLESGKFRILENLRFDPREESLDLEYAKELSLIGDVYINEAFASHRPAVSTTILPSLLPHAAGLHFAEEVRVLNEVRSNPKKPFIAIMGGAKVKDKLPVIEVLAKNADAVLVGGKLIHEIREQNLTLPPNVIVGKLRPDGFDIAEETTSAWKGLITKARMIVWNGPVGRFEDESCNQTKAIAEAITESGAETILGGGDTITAINMYGISPEKYSFVSTGGGAMLKLLSDATLPTIQALE